MTDRAPFSAVPARRRGWSSFDRHPADAFPFQAQTEEVHALAGAFLQPFGDPRTFAVSLQAMTPFNQRQRYEVHAAEVPLLDRSRLGEGGKGLDCTENDLS